MFYFLNLNTNEQMELMGILIESDEKEYPHLVLEYMIKKEFGEPQK